MIVAKGSGIDSGLIDWRVGVRIDYSRPGGMIRLQKDEVYQTMEMAKAIAEAAKPTKYYIERCSYCGVLYEGCEVVCHRCGGPR